MVDVRKTYKSIYQNLIDAGCNKNITDKCMLLVEGGRAADMLPILAAYRESLLSSVHARSEENRLFVFSDLHMKEKREL